MAEEIKWRPIRESLDLPNMTPLVFRNPHYLPGKIFSGFWKHRDIGKPKLVVSEELDQPIPLFAIESWEFIALPR